MLATHCVPLLPAQAAAAGCDHELALLLEHILLRALGPGSHASARAEALRCVARLAARPGAATELWQRMPHRAPTPD